MCKVFWTELWYFLLLLMAGFILVAFLSLGVSIAFPQLIDTVSYYHSIQWLQTVIVMIVPALIWSRWRTNDKVSNILFLHKDTNWKHYALVLVLSLLSLPLLDLLAETCRNIPLPEALKAMAEEESATQEVLLQKMLSVDGIGGWFELILLMSVATAIGEELTFRGALLSIFKRYSKCNKHLVAIVIGLIFSIIHMDLYGLIPRWLLGTAFVYLVYYTGSIWPSVLAHALNNLYALLQYKGIIE